MRPRICCDAYLRLVERVAIFADTHSDVTALRSILDDATARGIERLWCLGDFLGSGGTRVLASFDLVVARCELVLAGNHERFIAPETGPPIFLTLAGGWADHAYAAAMALGPERRARLAELPSYAVVPELNCELVHGSLADEAFGFVGAADEAAETLRLAQQPLVLCGHTHEPAYWEARPGLAGGMVAVQHAIKLDVEYELPRSRVCLNPGAGSDRAGARWLELRLDGERRSAVWRQTDTPGHGRKLPG